MAITAIDEVNYRRDLEARYRAMFEDEVRHMQMQVRGVGTGPVRHPDPLHPNQGRVGVGIHGVERESATLTAARQQVSRDAQNTPPTMNDLTAILRGPGQARPDPTPPRSKLLLLLKGK